jgi:hypothetical protein
MKSGFVVVGSAVADTGKKLKLLSLRVEMDRGHQEG